MRAQVIAVVSLQPNAGKTTLAVNMAASLFKRGYATLLMDLDPQAEASRALGVGVSDPDRSVYGALMGTAPVAGVSLPTLSGVDLIPGHPDLAQLAVGAPGALAASLKAAVSHAADHYAYIILDCPTGQNEVTGCARGFADRLIVPYLPVAGRESAIAVYTEFAARSALGPSVGLVANQVGPEEAQAVGGEQARGEAEGQVRHLGYVRDSQLLATTTYEHGLPPACRDSLDGAVQDIEDLVDGLLHDEQIEQRDASNSSESGQKTL